MALIDRGSYWQCAYVIPKGSLEELRARGLDEFRRQIGALVPFLSDRVQEIRAVGRRQAADRTRQSATPMVSSGTLVHRRCSARDVAYRRRRNQSRDPRCGCSGEYACRQAAARRRHGARSSRGSATARMGCAADPDAAALHSKQSHRPGALGRTRPAAATPPGARAVAAVSAAHSWPACRIRLPAGARRAER